MNGQDEGKNIFERMRSVMYSTLPGRIKDENGLKYIATKVNADTYKRWQKVMEDGGFKSDYELMQCLVSVFLRYADPEGDVEARDEEVERWSAMFEGWQNETTRINSSNPQFAQRRRMVETICIMSEVGKRGYVARRLTFQAEGKAQMNDNIDQAINAAIRKLKPAMAEQLMEIARGCGTRNMMTAIEEMLKDSKLPRLKEGEVEEMHISQTEYGDVPISHFSRHPKE